MNTSDYERVPVTSLVPGDVILLTPLVIGGGPKRATIERLPSKPFRDLYQRELVRIWVREGARPYSGLPEIRAVDFLARGTARRVEAAASTGLADQAYQEWRAAREALTSAMMRFDAACTALYRANHPEESGQEINTHG